MRPAIRLFIASFLLATVGVAVVLTATQNYLPKYTSGGSLVDSAVYDSGGNIGVGTTSPSFPLDVNGIAIGVGTKSASPGYGGNVRFRDDTGALRWLAGILGPAGETAWSVYDLANSASRISVTSAGNVGIGLAPVRKLDVSGDIRSTGGYYEIEEPDGATRNGLFVTHKRVTGGGINRSPAIFSETGLDVYLFTNGSVDASHTTVFTSGGFFGIGTTSPTAKLHVAGNVAVDGNIAAKYQDVAEWVTARDPVSPGTVVVIGSSETNIVNASQRGYDTLVAGVVSARPGLALGEKGVGKVLVAHTGRVPVKVDASYGPVRIGDLLVTSPTSGHAMRSEPLDISGAQFHRPGTLLGKALEPLASGQGEILVLLTLQ